MIRKPEKQASATCLRLNKQKRTFSTERRINDFGQGASSLSRQISGADFRRQTEDEMKLPFLPLDVPVMDEDHASLEKLFAKVPTTQDAGLSDLFDAIAAEISEHFAREEAVMEQAQVPILHCHKLQHAALLAEVAAMRPRLVQAEPGMKRHQIGFVLARHVADHIASVDQISSTFLLRDSEEPVSRSG